MVYDKYQAIVFDLDGTAIESKAEAMPSNALIKAVSNIQEHIPVSVATGRSWQHAAGPLQALGTEGPCIISGGTQIIYPTNRKIAWERVFTRHAIGLVVEFAKLHQKKIAYVSQLIVTPPHTPTSKIYSQPVNTIYMLGITQEEISLLSMFDDSDIIVSLTRSWTNSTVVDLHITPKNATKEHAISELCRLLNIDSKSVIGIGDGYNDLHLFNAVGLKIAMGNAEPELRDAADEVIGSVDEDGLAKYITSLVGG